MESSKVSSKWQVVIPRHVREAEQIRIGGDAMIAASSHGSVHVEIFDRDFARLARKLRTAPPVQFAVK